MNVYTIKRTITEFYSVKAENKDEALNKIEKSEFVGWFDKKTKDQVILSLPEFKIEN